MPAEIAMFLIELLRGEEDAIEAIEKQMSEDHLLFLFSNYR
jgi:hypothetical protein